MSWTDWTVNLGKSLRKRALAAFLIQLLFIVNKFNNISTNTSIHLKSSSGKRMNEANSQIEQDF